MITKAPNARRSHLRGRAFRTAVLLVTASWISVGARANAADPAGVPQPVGGAATVDTRPFFITPTIGVQESVTDNAYLTSTNRRLDSVTRAFVGINSNLNDGPATGTLTGQFSYDQYARSPNLSGWSLQGYGNGAYALVPNFLSLQAEGTETNGNVSDFGTSVVDRSGVAGRIQLGTYDIGPLLTTRLGSFADLDATARFGQVFYTAADASTATQLPSNDTFESATASIDTAKRLNVYELVTKGDFERDDQGFQSESGVQSILLNVKPQLTLIGRAGYESVYQPNVVDISSPILSAGFQYQLNRISNITLEGGERYNRPAWNANAYIQIANRVYFTGQYTEQIQPDQLGVANSFANFVVQTNQLPSVIAPVGFNVAGNLYNETSLDKTANTRLVYDTPVQVFGISVDYADRQFFQPSGHDRTLITSADYTRHIRPDLSLTLNASYDRTFASPLFGASDSYSLSGRVIYALNRTAELDGGYAVEEQRQLFSGGLSILENVIFIAVKKSF